MDEGVTMIFSQDKSDVNDIESMIQKIAIAKKIVHLLRARLFLIKSAQRKDDSSNTYSFNAIPLDSGLSVEHVSSRLTKGIRNYQICEYAINRAIQSTVLSDIKKGRYTNFLMNSLSKNVNVLKQQAHYLSLKLNEQDELFYEINNAVTETVSENCDHDKGTANKTNDKGASTSKYKKLIELAPKKIILINRMRHIIEALIGNSDINWTDKENEQLLNIAVKCREPCTLESICEKYDISLDESRKL